MCPRVSVCPRDCVPVNLRVPVSLYVPVSLCVHVSRCVPVSQCPRATQTGQEPRTWLMTRCDQTLLAGPSYSSDVQPDVTVMRRGGGGDRGRGGRDAYIQATSRVFGDARSAGHPPTQKGINNVRL